MLSYMYFYLSIVNKHYKNKLFIYKIKKKLREIKEIIIFALDFSVCNYL